MGGVCRPWPCCLPPRYPSPCNRIHSGQTLKEKKHVLPIFRQPTLKWLGHVIYELRFLMNWQPPSTINQIYICTFRFFFTYIQLYFPEYGAQSDQFPLTFSTLWCIVHGKWPLSANLQHSLRHCTWKVTTFREYYAHITLGLGIPQLWFWG